MKQNQKNKRWCHKNHQNKWDECHWLWQLKSTREEIYHAEEVKLSEVVVAHQKKIKRWFEDYPIKWDDHLRLQERISNGEQLDLAEDAKLNQLVAANLRHNVQMKEQHHAKQKRSIKEVAPTGTVASTEPFPIHPPIQKSS